MMVEGETVVTAGITGSVCRWIQGRQPDKEGRDPLQQ